MKKKLLKHISEKQPLTEELKEFIIMQQLKETRKKINKNRILQFNLRMMNSTFEEQLRLGITEQLEMRKKGFNLDCSDNTILEFVELVDLADISKRNRLEVTKGPKKYIELTEEDQSTIDTIISTVDINMALTSKTLAWPWYSIKFSDNYEVMNFTINDFMKQKNEGVVVSLDFKLNDSLRHFVMNAIFNGKHTVQPRYRILSECAFSVGEPVQEEEDEE